MSEPIAICNFAVILVTCLISWLGFRDRSVEEKYIFEPERILAGKQYYRLLTAGFLHADGWHLLLNLTTLYLFGNILEFFLGRAQFLLIYFGAIVGGNLLSLFVHRHHEYRAYGASGGVCGVVFAHILLFPGSGIRMFMMPFSVPGWLYTILFMLGSFYSLKAARDNIGHDAHLGGAIIGLLITAGLNPGTVTANPAVFFSVLILAFLLLVYLWCNPLFLPGFSFVRRTYRSRLRVDALPRYKRESMEVDAILEKVAREGTASLTTEERARLEEMSNKYRRRADSKKPDSGLAI